MPASAARDGAKSAAERGDEAEVGATGNRRQPDLRRHIVAGEQRASSPHRSWAMRERWVAMVHAATTRLGPRIVQERCGLRLL